MKLFVRNLSYDLTDEDLKEIFETVGGVNSAIVITDKVTGRSKGFGFVEMESADKGQEAIDSLNEKEYNGRPIYIDKARDNRPSTR